MEPDSKRRVAGDGGHAGSADKGMLHLLASGSQIHVETPIDPEHPQYVLMPGVYRTAPPGEDGAIDESLPTPQELLESLWREDGAAD